MLNGRVRLRNRENITLKNHHDNHGESETGRLLQFHVYFTLREKCPNTDQKKLSIWTLFTQCYLHKYCKSCHFPLVKSSISKITNKEFYKSNKLRTEENKGIPSHPR